MWGLLPDMAAKRAALSPGATAFVEDAGGRVWTFAEIDDAAARMGAGLRALGLAPGDRVAALSFNRVEMFVALFAAQKAGLILVPLNWRLTAEELAEQAEIVAPALLLHDAQHHDAAKALAQGRQIPRAALEGGPRGAADLLATPDPLPPAQVPADRPWYLLFTSGSTGRPQAVVQTAGMGWAAAVNAAQAMDLTAADRTVNYLPLFHTAGVNLFTLPVFLWGGTTRVLPRFDAERLLALLEEGAASVFFGVPSVWHDFAAHVGAARPDWSAIRCASGGAALPERLIRDFAAKGALIRSGYGMTETGPTCFIMQADRVEAKPRAVGRVQALTEVRLDGVPDGAPGEGEVWLRGPAITPGYWEGPDAIRPATDAEGWLRTGDVARRDAEGDHEIVGRLRDMFVSGGENVWPAEIERVLCAHPDVAEAAVIAVPDDRLGEVGHAFVEPRAGHCIAPETLSEWCRARLAGYKVPRGFTEAQSLPRTASGKIRKPALKDWPR
ncbi:acid--CoA ligase [Rhodosalinus halophilus]|uniref:Acid--CoA ligase n=2 Tax=Rhodosalinus halophilus TaxID=2259333 RepID=A0A365U9V3_9RHOB|nr:acid--CoA ligase [Rhodosalinus halophilus]